MASTLQHRPGVLGVGGSAMRAVRRLSRYVAIAVLSIVILLGAGVAVTQTSWFKNWLRQKAVSQAAQYLNGELTIARLGGNIFTGVELEGVALHHEGQAAVIMDKLTVAYSPLTMISEGLILDSLTLENPTILLQRNPLERDAREHVAAETRDGELAVEVLRRLRDRSLAQPVLEPARLGHRDAGAQQDDEREHGNRDVARQPAQRTHRGPAHA